MARDYFALLAAGPGGRDAREIIRRFVLERERLLSELDDPYRQADARRELDRLYLAYAVLQRGGQVASVTPGRAVAADAVSELRELIAASLEGGLLRYSRRQMILERAAELGLNEFQAQLLIAQVQFGEEDIPTVATGGLARGAANPRAWARVAGVGVLALAMFLFLVHWLGG